MQWAQGLKTACITVSDFDKTGSEQSVLVEPPHLRTAVRRLYKAKYFIEDVTVLDVAEVSWPCTTSITTRRPAGSRSGCSSPTTTPRYRP